mmetsp:Transcript_26214/g.38506  ORF Transcript_26214/g.38506 Transcript_26214/m.38506 type:complete len:94 (-) Transcript_26214:207-488(-)
MARRAVWCVVSAWKRESARGAHAQNQQDGNPRKLPAVPTGPQPGHEACECVCVSVRVCLRVCMCVCACDSAHVLCSVHLNSKYQTTNKSTKVL